MDEALRLLCGTRLNERVNFESFFFLTDSLTIGGLLNPDVAPVGPADNIGTTTASLQRFSPCNCDLLEVSGDSYLAIPGTSSAALTDVDMVSLCALRAVAFQLNAPADDTTDQETLCLLRQAIRCEGGDTNACGVCQAHCDCDSCCCNEGLLTELSRRNLSRQATFAAGPLFLRDVTVLGSVGSVLILWNETMRRIYLVCVDSIEVLG